MICETPQIFEALSVLQVLAWVDFQTYGNISWHCSELKPAIKKRFDPCTKMIFVTSIIVCALRASISTRMILLEMSVRPAARAVFILVHFFAVNFCFSKINASITISLQQTGRNVA